MLHCTQFLHLIYQIVLEHVCHSQLAHLDKENAPVLLSVSEQSFQLESEKAINWLSVLILSCLKRSDKGASFI